MADPRRSAESKSNKAIRSLSAPAYQVRNNRTCFLRKIFAVNNDDLSYLARPPMGETNQTVAGQNKSAAKMSQKQVKLWYRERRYLMDKLDKAEDDVYQRLLAIHKTKLMIEKARDASPDRSSIALYDRRASRATNGRGEDDMKKAILKVMEQREHSQVPIPEEGEINQTETDPQAKDNTDAQKESNTGRNESLKITIESVRVAQSPREIKAQETARLSNRPNTQANVSARGKDAPQLSERAKTEMGLIEEQTIPPVTPKVPESEMVTKPRQQTRVVEPPKPGPKKSTEEPKKSHARRIEEKILNERFTYWMQAPNGKLIPSDIPYKRREFPLPDERDDEGRKRDFLAIEKKSKNDNMKRFSHLCDDLVKLEEWNPLDEMRAMEELRRQAEKEGEDTEDRWKKLGMLRHWVRAFGMREAQELKGLDPNSEEALKKCKYMRINNETTSDSMESKAKSKKKRSKSKDPSKDTKTDTSKKKNSWAMDQKDPTPPREVQTGQEPLTLNQAYPK